MILLGLRYALRERARFTLTGIGVACSVVLSCFLAGVYRGGVRGSMSFVEDAEAVVTLLKHLTRDPGVTVLVVSHDARVARRADLRIVLSDGKIARTFAEEETPCGVK